MFIITTIKTTGMNLKKIIFSILIISIGIGLSAQNNTSSPYSGFGIGELEMSSGGRNTGMGQTGIALRSNLFMNTANPASLTAIDPQSFLFDMGVNFEYTKLESRSKSVNVTDGNLSWLQLGFPISKKLFGAISLNPKSSVGYNIFTLKSVDGLAAKYQALYEGTGGLSEAGGMLAWKLSNNISLGAKAGYIWGNVAQTLEQSIVVSSTGYTLIQEDNIQYAGSYFNLGTQLSIPFSSKSSFVLGSVVGLSSRLNSETSTTITKSYSSSSEIMASDVESSSSAKLPIDFGIGVSFLYGPKWVATADYKRSDWENATLNISSDKLSTNNSYRVGFEFAPKNDPKSFKQSARYRMGYRFDTGYLKMYNNQIHEQAITFGAGIPIRKDRSFANFSVELGMRGTKASNLVEEKFVKLNCSFNLWDRWFTKRQID
jgi:hypothetical protein